MSLDKAIEHKKEYRKPYRRSRAWDTSCRNHGSCGWCYGNRMHKHKRRYVNDEEWNYYDQLWRAGYRG